MQHTFRSVILENSSRSEEEDGALENVKPRGPVQHSTPLHLLEKANVRRPDHDSFVECLCEVGTTSCLVFVTNPTFISTGSKKVRTGELLNARAHLDGCLHRPDWLATGWRENWTRPPKPRPTHHNDQGCKDQAKAEIKTKEDQVKMDWLRSSLHWREQHSKSVTSCCIR